MRKTFLAETNFVHNFDGEFFGRINPSNYSAANRTVSIMSSAWNSPPGLKLVKIHECDRSFTYIFNEN